MRERGWLWLVISVLVLLPVLSACSSDENGTPALAAPPTRTTSPATPTPAPDDLLANLEIISLRDNVQAFLDESAEISPLDRPVSFNDNVFATHPECYSQAFYSNTEPLELMDFNLISLDLTIWQAAVDAFPEADLIAAIEEAFAMAAADVPLDAPFRVCIFPSPAWAAPEEMRDYGFGAQTLSDDLLLGWCGGGDACTLVVDQVITFAYHYAVQLQSAELTTNTMTLLDWVLFNARAEDFTRDRVPDAQFAWDAADLTPALEADVWSRMRDFLDVTYADYPDYRKIDRFLYGRGTDTYPDWAGMLIGAEIVRAFRDNNPYVTVAELAALPSRNVLEQSRYMP